MRLYGIRRENGYVIRTYVPSHFAEPMKFLARIYLGRSFASPRSSEKQSFSENIGGQLVGETRVPAENYPFGDAAMADFMRLNRKIMGVLRSLEARKS